MQNPNCFDEAYLTNGRWPGPTLAEIEKLQQHHRKGFPEGAGGCAPLRDMPIDRTTHAAGDAVEIFTQEKPR